jgi:hypothetical protein
MTSANFFPSEAETQLILSRSGLMPLNSKRLRSMVNLRRAR